MKALAYYGHFCPTPRKGLIGITDEFWIVIFSLLHGENIGHIVSFRDNRTLGMPQQKLPTPRRY